MSKEKQPSTLHQGIFAINPNLEKISQRYKILEELGRGAMGRVYKALDNSLQRTVAIKILAIESNTQDKHIARFMREARIIANLDHPNIVKIFDISEDPYFFAMEYIEGGTLGTKISQKPLAVRKSLETITTIANAISYLHQKGILHRDLKPANIMLDKNGIIKVMDFGLAKTVSVDQKLSVDGVAIGTIGYMAPEQYSGSTDQINEQSDVYALGVILYEMLTKQIPFAGDTPFNIFSKQLTEKPSPPSSFNRRVSQNIDIVCFKAMEPETEDRYKNVQEFSADIKRITKKKTITAKPVGKGKKLARDIKKQPIVAILALVVLLLSVALLSLAFKENPVAVALSTIENSLEQADTEKMGEDKLVLALLEELDALTQHSKQTTATLVKTESLRQKTFEILKQYCQKQLSLIKKDLQIAQQKQKIKECITRLGRLLELPGQTKTIQTSILFLQAQAYEKAGERQWALKRYRSIAASKTEQAAMAKARIDYLKSKTPTGAEKSTIEIVEPGGWKQNRLEVEAFQITLLLKGKTFSKGPAVQVVFKGKKLLWPLQNGFFSGEIDLAYGTNIVELFAWQENKWQLGQKLQIIRKTSTTKKHPVKRPRHSSESNRIAAEIIKKDPTDQGLERIKHLTNISWINLRNTKISDAGLVYLKGFTKISRLDLHRANINGSGFVHLKDLTNIKDLTASMTKFNDEGLAHIKGFTNLTRLNLRRTDISDAGLVYLKKFAKLSTLTLDWTKIGDVGLANIKELNNLSYLSLQSTKTSDSGLAYLKELNNLSSLRLGGTQISDAGLIYLQGLSQLEKLYMSSTKVGDAGLLHLKGLSKLSRLTPGKNITNKGLQYLSNEFKQLSHLDLYYTDGIDARGLLTLKKFPNLIWFTLFSHQIEDKDLVFLKHLSNLNRLALGHIEIEDIGMTYITKLAKLKMLDFRSARISELRLQKLKAALPNCKIYEP